MRCGILVVNGNESLRVKAVKANWLYFSGVARTAVRFQGYTV